MFAQISDFDTNIYGYQIDQITEGNDDIALQALATAEAEVKAYLTGNYNNDYNDGRLRYDADVILSQTGTNRNPLILTHVVTIAKWHLVQLCNADVVYEQAKERYDRAVEFLTKVAKGQVNMSDLPQLSDEDKPLPPLSWGSRTKFIHEF